MNFGTVLTAMVTPFDENGKVNIPKAQELATHLIDNGSDGIVVAGTTGETPNLNFDEKIILFKAIKEAVGNKGYVIAGTTGNNTDVSLNMTKETSKLEIDGLMMVVPYYNKPSQEGLYNHFKTLASATDLPVMLYNIPSRTGSNLLPETVERLAEIGNITAIKEASGSMEQVTELKKRLGENFYIYSGDDSLTLPMLSLGGNGVVSVASHLVGSKIKEMIDKFKNGDHQGALNIHLNLIELFKTLFITTNPVPVKEALNLLGWGLGGVKLPLVDASDDDKNVIDNMLKKYSLK